MMKRKNGNSAENPKHEIQNSKQTSIAKKKLRTFGATTTVPVADYAAFFPVGY
jgi:hypothetical protein